ncbi:hypothetical protein C9374_001712 [Naegleria lovaniensis]|uniref:NlpC/P60 domain-containing protein n=1 Tax=Naegleria lovaniensis TaxID=51637 RepID=A0AA88GR69_NAELO|nr:uncharacterized protein C9374_001712 [Naegleria lovaniensis]KAG2387380.1 hypothetical protein C9374_001712 [Naegleria lovaniensis]
MISSLGIQIHGATPSYLPSIPSNVVASAISTQTNVIVYSGKNANDIISNPRVVITQLQFQECVFIVESLNPITDASGEKWLLINIPMQTSLNQDGTTSGVQGFVKRDALYILVTSSSKITSSTNMMADICPTMSDVTSITSSEYSNSKLSIVKSDSAELFKRRCSESGCTKEDLIFNLSFGTLLYYETVEKTDGWRNVKIITGNGTLGSSQSFNTLFQNAYIRESDITSFKESTRERIASVVRPDPDSTNFDQHPITKYGLKLIGCKYIAGGRSISDIESSDYTGMDATGLTSLLYMVTFSKRIPRTINDQYKAADSKISMNGFHTGDLIFLSNTSSDSMTNVMVFAGKDTQSNEEFIIESTENGGVKIMTVTQRLGVKSVRNLSSGDTILNGKFKFYYASFFERSIQDEKFVIELLLYIFVLGTVLLAIMFIVTKHVYKKIKLCVKGSVAARRYSNV